MSGIYPKQYRWNYTTPDGREVHFRPIRATDEDKLQRLFHSLTSEDIYFRFMGSMRSLPHKAAKSLVDLDYEDKYAIVASIGEEPHEELVGVCRWALDRNTNMADVAITVHPQWQRLGIGTFMLDRLIEVAKEKGIRGFTAMVLGPNRRMMNLLHKSGLRFQSKIEYSVFSIVFPFDEMLRKTGTG